MADRLKKLRRIQAVQADMHRLAEWRLAVLTRKEQQLTDDQTALIGTLNSDDTLHGLFVAAMARRLRALAGETEVVRAAKETQADKVLEEAKRLKRTERMSDRAAVEHERSLEKVELQRLVEALVARRRDASLP